jgi:hypothetical protein
MSSAEIVDGRLVLDGPGTFEVSEPVGQTIEVKEGKTRSRKVPEGVVITELVGDGKEAETIYVSLGEEGEEAPAQDKDVEVEADVEPSSDEEEAPEEEPEAVKPDALQRDEKGSLVLSKPGTYFFPDGTSVLVQRRTTKTIAYEGEEVSATEYRPHLFAVEVDGVSPEPPAKQAVYRRTKMGGRVIQRDPGLVFFGDGDDADFMGVGSPSEIKEVG